MNHTSMRTTRRLTGLAVALTTVLSVAGVAQANHSTCTQAGENYPNNGGNALMCPEFSPVFTSSIRYPYRDTPAAIQIEPSQARHESLPLKTEVYYPKGWQFSVGSIDPSTAPDCATAIGSGDQTNGYLAGRPIEALTNAVGLRAYEGASGVRNLGRASTSKTAGDNMIGFLNWDPAYTAPGVQGRATLCLAMNGGNPKDVVETMYLDALTNDPDYGWRLSIDTGRIFNPANQYVGTDAGLAYFDIDFNDTTMGNHHRVNGVKTRVVWSRANYNSTQAKWKAVLTTCRSGVVGYNLANCPADHVYSVAKEQGFVVSLPPAMPGIPFAQITAGGGVAIPGSGTGHVGNPQPVQGFGFSDGKELAGGTTIPVKFNLPTVPAGAQVTGFATAIQEITADYDPTNQDAEIAAGRLRYERFDKTAAICPTTACELKLDVAGLSPANGTMDGKYNIGLVTIYSINGNDGYRSDLLCDGKLAFGASHPDTGRGVLCPAGRPAFLPGAPFAQLGASRWQVVVRERAWPTRYRISNPQSLLLLDMVTREAEYYIWGATQAGGTPPRRSNLRTDIGPGERYLSASNVVVNPTSPTQAAFVFGKLNLDQDWSYSWQLVGELGVPLQPFYAQFQEWWSGWADPDWVKLPSVNPANPTNPQVCTSAQVCGSNQRAPHMIITELSGSTF